LATNLNNSVVKSEFIVCNVVLNKKKAKAV